LGRIEPLGVADSGGCPFERKRGREIEIEREREREREREK